MGLRKSNIYGSIYPYPRVIPYCQKQMYEVHKCQLDSVYIIQSQREVTSFREAYIEQCSTIFKFRPSNPH